MITRRIGKLLRGRATPLQVLLASLLGALVAFVPAPAHAPGLVLALVLALLVLNANLGVALLVAIPARLFALAAMPVSFAIGRFLLDGPTRGLFSALVDAPVLAWFGLDYYATTGGLVLGALFGVLCGLGVNALVRSLRRKLAGLEEGSERYREFTRKGWVRALLFVFAGGGKGKKTYAELLSKRFGNPIRIPGAIFAVVVLGALWLLQRTLASPYLAAAAQTELSRANGATVDLETLELDLAGGRLVATGLAVCDPEDLARDLLRAGRLEADVSTGDLLRRRLVVSSLVLSDARHAAPRSTPGARVGPPPPPPAEPPPPREGERTMEDVLAEAEVWKERLRQAREWLERLGEGSEETGADGEVIGPDDESWRERLEREARERGWANVRATQLRTAGPTLLVSRLAVEGLVSASLPDEVLDVVATNLSTHPRLVEGAPRIEVTSRSGDLSAVLGLDAFSKDPAASRLAFTRTGMVVDEVAAGLVVDGVRPVKGGTLDVALEGTWGAGGIGTLDLPLAVTLHDTELTIPGVGSQQVERFALPVSLRGPLDGLRVKVDGQALQQALTAAGADELARRARDAAREQLDGVLDGVKQKLPEGLEENLPGSLKDLAPQGELPGGVEDELKKKAGGLLEGLGGKKKKP